MDFKKKVILFCVAFAILLAFLYLHQYQTLINEGSVLADEHCIKVSPLIIDRKNKYMDFMRMVIASGSADLVNKSLNDYVDTSRKYGAAEKIWLAKDSAYQSQIDFKLIVPGYMQKAASFQYDMFKYDYLSSIDTNSLMDPANYGKGGEVYARVADYVKKENQAADAYNAIWNEPRGFDPRNFFTRVPESKCPTKNLDIPDVNEFLKNPNPSTDSPNT